MSDEQGYNGWANYETWCVSMWLDNDEGYYHGVRDIVGELSDLSAPAGFAPVWELGRAVREYVEAFDEVTAVTEGPASFVVDLLGAAFSEVDWDEIGASIRSELASEVDA